MCKDIAINIPQAKAIGKSVAIVNTEVTIQTLVCIGSFKRSRTFPQWGMLTTFQTRIAAITENGTSSTNGAARSKSAN
jgi:hypothetical protein